MEISIVCILREKPVLQDVETELQTILAAEGTSGEENIILSFAASLEQGEALLFEHAPSLLIVDAGLEGSLEFVQTLKGDEVFRFLPVLIADTEDREASIERFFSAGADSSIPAPFTQHMFMHYIHPLIRNKLQTDNMIGKVTRLQEENIRNFILLDLVKRYIPRTVWDIASRFAEEQKISIPETEEEVTIVYGDIAGFTTMSQYLPPKEVISMLNEAYEVVTKLIYTHEGDIDKFIGDAFLAVFTDPKPAILAALNIQFALQQLNDDRQRRGLSPISFRIGVHTGPVIRGNVGGQLRNDNTLIGDTVNTSSRIENITPPGEVLVSEQSCIRAGISIPQMYRVEEKVKGKDTPIISYNIFRYSCDRNRTLNIF